MKAALLTLLLTLPLSVLSATCAINADGCNLPAAVGCDCVSTIQTCNSKKGTICALGSCDGVCEYSPAFYGITIGVPLLLLGLLIWCCCSCCCRSRDGGRRGMDERTILLVAPTQLGGPPPFAAPAPAGQRFCPACGAAKEGKFCSACGAGG